MFCLKGEDVCKKNVNYDGLIKIMKWYGKKFIICVIFFI